MSGVIPKFSILLVLAVLMSTWPVGTAQPVSITEGTPPQANPVRPPDHSLTFDLPDQAAKPAVPAATAAFQYSLSLDGTGDYVEVPDSPALNPDDQLTIEAWVRRASIGCQTIVGKNYLSSYWLGFCNDTLRFYTGGGTCHDGNTIVPAGVWTHVAVVWVAPSVEPTAVVTYYINGELDYSGSSTGLFTSTAPLYIGADIGDSPSFLYELAGNLAEVRIWRTARSQDDIRRTMHVALNEPRPGLVAVWHLTDDAQDSIGSNHGTLRDNAVFTEPQAPPRPALVPIDQNFSQLPQTRYGAATAYVPSMNRAVLVGGYGGGGYFASVDFVDPSNGYLTTTATLPGTGREDAVAAFAAANDTVYVFGGYTFPSTWHSTIYAINPHDGAVRTVAATLPFGMTPGAAVYHQRLNKIYILGGASSFATRLNTIYVFDPATETIASFSVTPTPAGLDDFAAAYSPVADKIYIFGGRGPTILSTTFALDIGANPLAGSLRWVTTASLPSVDLYMRAVEDPVTRLIYVIGGAVSDRVLVFDPVHEQLWQTPAQLPETRESASIVYDNRNRQAVLMGGRVGATAQQDIWRIPLGDGPQLALGRWDFPQSGSLSSITAINGSGKRALVGRADGTLSSYNSDGTRDDWPLGSAINDARYNAENDHLWAATDSGGGKLIVGGSVTTIYSDTQQMWAIDLRPGYLYTNSAPFFGTKSQGLQWPDLVSGHYEWRTTFPNNSVRATTHRALGDLWAMVNGNVQRMMYTPTLGYDLVTTSNYGGPCAGALYNAQDLAFDRNGDLWVVSPNYLGLAAARGTHRPASPAISGQGVCQIIAPTGAAISALRTPEIGVAATTVDVDADGRIWVSVKSQPGETGGLMVYQNLSGTVRSAATNWLTGPVGSLISVTSGSTVVGWKSGFNAVGAADERVWAGKEDGHLATVAPRWQQLDEVGNLRQQQVLNVWMARGRLFAATISGTVYSLYVLMPDGKTWEVRDVSSAPVMAVLGDSRGRIWAGTTTDVRLYTPTGWDMLTNVAGNKPTSYVDALAEDGQGRVWIGGGDGLTLFDRNRYVATFNTSNSPLPNDSVQALLPDEKHRLFWVGTADKLAAFNGDSWLIYSTADGLPSNYIYDLAVARDGRVAVSTDNGLAFFSSTSGTFYTETVPGQTAYMMPLTVDDQGRLWAGSAVRNSGGWQAYYQTNSGLIASYVSDNAADRAGHVWFSHWPIAGGLSVRGTFLPPLSNVEPTILGISPISGSAGTVITITGSGFSSNPSDINVAIGGAPVELLSASETRLTVRAGPETTSGAVSVSSRGRRVSYPGVGGRRAFCAVPVITSFDPTGGNNGVPITIQGTNFDPDGIRVALGGGAQRIPFLASPTELRVYIEPGDGVGTVNVINHPLNCEAYTASASQFRRFDLGIANISLNQGLSAYGLMANRPMLVSSFLTHTLVSRGPTERFEVDLIQLRLTDAANHSVTYTIPHSLTVNAVPTLDPVLLLDTVNAINVKDMTPSVPGFVQGSLTTRVTLWRSGRLVAQNSRTDTYRPNRVFRVLLVPYVPSDYTDQELADMQANVERGADDLRRRIMPTGQVELIWSSEFVRVPANSIKTGNAYDLFVQSHRMDSIRQRWNERHPSYPAMIAFGVLQTRAIDTSDQTPGQAFWPDTSALINLILGPLDTLCDITTGALEFLTVGLFDGGCDLEIPLYVGWAKGNDGQTSELFGHEFGHIFTLVSPRAPNGNLLDNLSHSVNDEIDPGECGHVPSYYNRSKTLYRQPGVSEPVVNPITGAQFYPEPPPPDPEILDAYNRKRGKAIMSYACTRENDNVFYEPVDAALVHVQYSLTSADGFWRDLRGTVQTADVPRDAAATGAARVRLTATGTVTGPRLFVSGVISRTLAAGKLDPVQAIGDNALVSLGDASGYWLIQRSITGTELSRYGVIPRFNTSPYTPTDTGFFAATILRASGVVTLELRKDSAVLDSFHAGSAAPVVNIVSPSGGEVFNTGVLPISWTATDADGDPLNIEIDYSRDGTEWLPIGSMTGTNTISVPVFLLGGSTSARVRVTANDGFDKGSATSAAFTVANRPPRPYISQPASGATILEGERLALVGGANDSQDRRVADTGLSWSSSRDGALGTGNDLGVFLNVGVHTVTLTATNSVGLTATTFVTLTVRGDYDYDGIPDDEELAAGLYPLSENDAFSDNDKDGLPLIMERRRNTDPTREDSDEDKYSDAAEILAGTDPNDQYDDPGTLPADQLAVNPSPIVLTADLALDTPWAQQPVQVSTRNPASWTLSADVDWLGASARSGSTPAGSTILVEVYKLGDGIHTAVLTFTSITLKQTVAVPVTVTISNRLAYCDVNRDGASNGADVQGVIARLGLGRSDPLYNYHYDLNRNEKIDTEDVQVIVDCILTQKVYLPLVLRSK